jgi:hypothetical protein
MLLSLPEELYETEETIFVNKKDKGTHLYTCEEAVK